MARLSADVERLLEERRTREQDIKDLIAQLTGRTLPALSHVAQQVTQQPQAAQPNAALGKLEDLVARVEKVLGDERST